MKVNTKKCISRIISLVLIVCVMASMAIPAFALEAATGIDEVKYGVFKFNWLIQGESYSRGTAFLINDEYIITAGHCVAYSELFLDMVGITGWTEQYFLEEMSYSVTVERDLTVGAELITYSEDMDFAILKLKQPIPTRKYLVLRDSTTVKAGETVFSVGYPSFFDSQTYDNDYTIDDVTIKTGVISKVQGLAEYMTGDGHHFKGNALNTTCTLSGGDSGGPMVDANGYVIGVSISGLESSVSDSYYTASAIDQVIRACDNLGIEYTLDTELTEEPATEPATEPTTEAATEPATEAATEPATEAATEPATEPAVEDTTKKEDVSDKKEGDNSLITILVVAALAVVAVIIAVVVVLTKGKKQKAPAAVGGGYVPPAPPAAPAAPAAGFAAAPHAPAYTAPMDAGETTVLNQDAGETTVLSRNVNGGMLIRKKNGEQININAEKFVIGRDRKVVNYCVSDNTSISRSHVTLEVRGDATYLVDMNAANGTFVNGVKAIPRKEIVLKNGDKITLSDEEFEYRK